MTPVTIRSAVAPRARRVARIITSACLTLGLTIALILAIEGLAYVLVQGFGLATGLGSAAPPGRAAGYEDRAWAVEYFKELGSLPGFRWHSYVYWRRLPHQGRFITIDKDGRRQTWSAAPEGAASLPRYRIFMMGGSTMWGTGARDDETIPSIVARRLTRDHGLSVEVTNFGESAYISTQEVIALLRELERGNRPHLVIFYDGVNDTFGTYQHRGVAGIPHNEVNRKREFNLLRPGKLGRLYREVALVTFQSSSTFHVIRAVARRVTGRDLFAVDEARFAAPPSEEVAREVARVYAWNVTLVKGLSQTHGFKALFYWQPNIFTKDPLAPYEQQLRGEGGGTPYVAARRAVSARLAGVDGFHDLSGVFEGDARSYFIDGVHVTEAGNDVVARRMLTDIVPIVQACRGGRC